MTQSKYTRPDNTTQSASAYKANIDNGFETFERAAGSQFQAHEQSTPDMTVRLEAGDLWDGPGNAPDVIAAQSTGTITAPSTNPRIDRVVIDTSGVVSVITGSEAASPTAPAVTSGKIPICQVALATSTTSITNSLITDERPSFLGDPASATAGIANVVEDTTPQLGGQLDVNGNAIGDGTLELLAFTETGSAVNHVDITNAATGDGPIISAVGDDTNVNLNLAGKGTGGVNVQALSHGWVSNLGIDYTAGTFTIQGADGTSLSSTNPAYVTMQDKSTPGLLRTYTVTADQNFIDDAGSSEIIGNLFGATSGVAWGNDCPFYIYAVSNDAESAIAFMISRVPHLTTSPGAGEIGAPDDAVADNEYSFFSFDNIDETTYDTNPCVCIGSFRMQMSASDDWTVQTLSIDDGIGHFHESTVFDYPQGQNNAGSSSHVLTNGGTIPVFSTNTYKYKITRDGMCDCWMQLDGDGGTDGSGAVTFNPTLPLRSKFPGGGSTSEMTVPVNVETASIRNVYFTFTAADYSLGIRYAPTGGQLNHSDFGNGNRSIRFFYRFPIKDS